MYAYPRPDEPELSELPAGAAGVEIVECGMV
jgi:hypothetical protein